jgi:hypothetical protein
MTPVRRMRWQWLCVVFVSLALLALAHAQTGQYDWSAARDLCPGIKYAHVKADTPRPLNLNCLQVDTRTPGLSFVTTPRCDPWEENVTETVRKSTRQFMQEARAQGVPMVVAINADAWTPWISATWDQPTRPNVKGLAVSDGVLVSPGSGTPSLIIRKNGTLEMAQTEAATDISTIQTAVSGFAFVLMKGEVLPADAVLHPRTATGLSEDGRMLYLLTVDGRQAASGGVSYPELAGWLRHFGAYTGINMDGGGSTTMVWWDPQAEGPDKCSVLNVPVGDGSTAGRERCNGNNLGVCYRSAQP